jgi:mono/diheme cytochrome c family protein
MDKEFLNMNCGSLKRVSAVAALFAAGALIGWGQKDAKDLYLDRCASCHGPDGAGKTARGKKLKLKGVKDTSTKMSAEEMQKVVENGKGADMDAFGKEFSKDQIRGLVDYYRSLAK